MSIGADDERMGYVVEHWISMERAIAMAWLHRHPDGTRTVIEDEIELVAGSWAVNVRRCPSHGSWVSECAKSRLRSTESASSH
jgi:hypothetical protein